MQQQQRRGGGATQQQQAAAGQRQPSPQQQQQQQQPPDGAWAACAPVDSARAGPTDSSSSDGVCVSPHMSRDGSYASLTAGAAAAAAASSGGGGLSAAARGMDPATRSKLAEQHHARGYAARKQGRFEAAVDEYSRTLALAPRHFKALFNRGFSFDKLGQYALAVTDYSAALALCPDNSFALYNRGITKDRMGDYAGAVDDFTAAAALDPNNADFYHNRGFSLRKQVRAGDCQQPASRYERMLHSPPASACKKGDADTLPTVRATPGALRGGHRRLHARDRAQPRPLPCVLQPRVLARPPRALRGGGCRLYARAGD